jgi:hypothetical protein
MMEPAACYDGPGHDYRLDGVHRNAKEQPVRDQRGHREAMVTLEFACSRCGAIAKHALWLSVGRTPP